MGEWAVRIPGKAVPQGDLFCTGKKGKNGRHVLVHSNAKTLKPWRELVGQTGPAIGLCDLAGPVGVEVTFTIARPKSHYRTGRYAHLLRDDAPAWPYFKGTGDADKLARAVLDGLSPREGRKTIADDVQVCRLASTKVYPDTPDPHGELDRMPAPGVVIRIYTLT